MHDHAHTMTFSPDSKLIKLHLWAWEGNSSQINFCKLFWGTPFLPVALFFKAIFTTVDFLKKRLPESVGPTFDEIREEDNLRKFKRKAKREAKEAKGPNFLQRTLTNIGSFFDKIAAFFQSHPNIGKSIAYTLIVIPAIAVVGIIVYGFVVAPIGMLIGLGVLVGAGLTLLLIFLSAIYLDESGKSERAGKAFSKGFNRIGEFLSTGYHAVKYRTCPAVVIEDPATIKGHPA